MTSQLAVVTARAYAEMNGVLIADLDDVEEFGTMGEEWTERDERSARDLIEGMTTLFRYLVFAHRPDTAGNCGECVAQSWPCQTMRTVQVFAAKPESIAKRLYALPYFAELRAESEHRVDV